MKKYEAPKMIVEDTNKKRVSAVNTCNCHC